MMKKEELTELEKLMQAKLEQKEFEYKDAYWQQFNEQRNGGKRTRMIYWFISLLALLGSTVAAFTYYHAVVGTSGAAQQQEAKQATAVLPDPVVMHNPQLTDVNKKPDNNVKTKEQPERNDIAQHAKTEPENDLNLQVKEEMAGTQIGTKTTQKESEPGKTETGTLISQQSRDMHPDNKIVKKGQPSAASGKQKEITPDEGKEVGNADNAQPQATSAIAAGKVLVPLVNNNDGSRISQTNDQANLAYENQINHGFQEMMFIEPKTPNVVKPAVNGCDTCMKKVKDFLAYKKSGSAGYFTIHAGVNYFMSDKQGLSNLGYSAGIHYLYPLGSNLYIGTGLLFSRVRYELPFIQTNIQRYSFGLTRELTRYQTNGLDYVEIPLELGICFNKRHYITAGMAYNQLISAQTYITRSLSGEQNKTSRELEQGKPSYINNNDIVINAGYRYYFNNSISVTAAIHWGLNDITSNTVYQNTEVNNNRGFKLMLGYKLSK